MSRSIQVVVGPTGEVTIEAAGFKGQACEKATAALEAALGVVKGRKKKPDYYAQAVVATQQRVGR